MSKLTHLDEDGSAHMVDVSAKEITSREAIATGHIAMSAEAAAAIAQASWRQNGPQTSFPCVTL